MRVGAEFAVVNRARAKRHGEEAQARRRAPLQDIASLNDDFDQRRAKLRQRDARIGEKTPRSLSRGKSNPRAQTANPIRGLRGS